MKYTRYVSKKECEFWSAEVSFNGNDEAEVKEPDASDVKIKLLSRINKHLNDSPWQLEWEKNIGNVKMPSGAWNGIQLVEIVQDMIFFAVSNQVICISAETGKQMWKVCIGNTPIYNILASTKNDSIIVYNGYYGFESSCQNANIVKLDFTGGIVWRSEKPKDQDVFSNPPYYKNGKLYANSWNGFLCEISEKNGSVKIKQFTK